MLLERKLWTIPLSPINLEVLLMQDSFEVISAKKVYGENTFKDRLFLGIYFSEKIFLKGVCSNRTAKEKETCSL